jgi:hypothetical protein
LRTPISTTGEQMESNAKRSWCTEFRFCRDKACSTELPPHFYGRVGSFRAAIERCQTNQ